MLAALRCVGLCLGCSSTSLRWTLPRLSSVVEIMVTTSDHQDHKTADARLYHTNTYLSGMSKEPKIIRRASRGPDILRPNDAQTARLGRALSAARGSGVIRARNRAQSQHMSRERSSQRARSPSTRTRGRIERDPAPERRLRSRPSQNAVRISWIACEHPAPLDQNGKSKCA